MSRLKLKAPHFVPEGVDLAHLHLNELLDFRPDQGVIRLHEQRVVLLSAAAMGLLRKELIDTLGLETARRSLWFIIPRPAFTPVRTLTVAVRSLWFKTERPAFTPVRTLTVDVRSL